MGASVTYKYNKTSDGLWMVLLGIPLLIAYGLGLILIIIGIIRMKGTKKAKKIRANGVMEYGKIAYKVKENNETTISLKKNKVIFYYKTKDGLLGRTIQSINKKTYQAISKLENNIVPIRRLNSRAVIDLERLNQPIENVELDFSSQEPAYRYKYGEVRKSSIVLLVLATILYLSNDLLIFVIGKIASESVSGITIITTTVIILLNIALLSASVILFIIGVSKLSYYGLAKKIRKDGETHKKGTLVPIINKKNGSTILVLPNKAIFQYVSEDGLLIQTQQIINKKMFNKIMESGNKEIPIIELNNYAVIDNDEMLGKEETKLDKLFKVIKKYHIFFFFALISNIYFLVSEIIHYVQSSFLDGISLFTIVIYSLTLLYMIFMELLDFLNKKGYWAYTLTLLFLVANIISTIVTLTYDFMNQGIYFVHKSNMTLFGVGSIYFIYIMYKITKSIVNGKTAKMLDLDYERCQDMGDTVSNVYTIVNFVAWTIASYFIGKVESANIGVETVLFFAVVAFNFVASIIYLTKCAIGINKSNRLRKENMKD